MKRLRFILLFFISLTCSATKYYVKNTGSDANTGLSDVQAWQTINKINTSTFSAGDTIAFKCGDIWRETLTIPSSGTSGSYLVFTSYGTGNKPKIYGSELETVWHSGDIPEVAANNDLLVESFEGAGYQNAWSETIGANESNLVDEDNADVARPTGGGSQILKIVKDITPTATNAASAAKIVHDFGSVQPATYTDFYMMINAHGLTSSGQDIRLFVMHDGSTIAGGINLLRTSLGYIVFEVFTNINSTYTVSYYYESGASITLDHWYHIQFSYDVTGGTYSAIIDDHSVLGGSISGVSPTGVRYMELGSALNIHTLTAYFDLLNVSSTNFYSPLISIPANVWYSDDHYNDPYGLPYHGNIFFKETTGSISWGHMQKTVLTDINSEYEWGWKTNRICIYSATDPNTRYSGVEITQRLRCIDTNNKEYLTFNNLELAYANRQGISTLWTPSNLSGLKMLNSYIHHIGVRIDVPEGYGIWCYYSDVLVSNNIIHDCGRRGISINPNGAVIPYTLQRIVIEDNIFYHGNHTTGIDIIDHESCAMDSIIIRRNLIYDDPAEADDEVESLQSEGSFIANQGGTTVTKVYFYDNIIKNTKQSALKLENLDEIYVYNNTFYGINPNLTTGESLLYIGLGNGYVIKNNIFYNNVNSAINAVYSCMYISSTVGTITSDYNLFYKSDPTGRFIHWKGTNYTMAQWATYKTASSQDAYSPAPADPLFYSSTDYRLQLASPALHTGVNLGLLTDYTGRAWANPPSLGALEYPSTNSILMRDGSGNLLRTSGGKLIRK